MATTGSTTRMLIDQELANVRLSLAGRDALGSVQARLARAAENFESQSKLRANTLKTLGEQRSEFQEVAAEKRVVGESAMAYLYDHTATLFLVNPQGELEVQYLYGTNYRNIVSDVSLILNANS